MYKFLKVALLAAILSLGVSGAATQSGYAKSNARVRVLNAIVDCTSLTIQVANLFWDAVPYGQRTDYVEVPGGRTVTHVSAITGERLSNDVVVNLQPGFPHTVIFTGFVTKSGNYTPIVLRDTTAGRPVMSNSQFTFVNAMSDKTSVTFTMNGQSVRKASPLAFGSSSPQLGYAPNDYEVTIVDTSGKTLYSTKFKALGGTRYTAVALGAIGEAGNRAPRIFFYSF